MAKGKKRAKAQAERARKRAAKFGRYQVRADKLPSPETKYGARWWARRRGEPIGNRSNENPSWFRDETLRLTAHRPVAPPSSDMKAAA